jgi:hypothetical protein
METISDIVGDSNGNGDKLPIKKIADLLGKKLVLNSVKVLKDFPGKFGTADRTILVLSEKLGSDMFECWTSSKIITERALKVKEMGKLPIVATILKKDTAKGYFYTLE